MVSILVVDLSMVSILVVDLSMVSQVVVSVLINLLFELKNYLINDDMVPTWISYCAKPLKF
jgi:hypothetical protein